MRILKNIFNEIRFILFPYELKRIRRCYIYGIRKKNTKRILYIGSTCNTLENRLKEHISEKSHSNKELYELSKRVKLEIYLIKKVRENERFKVEHEIINNHKNLMNKRKKNARI